MSNIVTTSATAASESGGSDTNDNDADNSVEEVLYCRVCHMESEPGNELYHPCKCSGSIKWVHQACLVEWLKVKHVKNPKCELCGFEFQFQSIYANDTPLTLTVWDMIVELVPRAKHVVKMCANLTMFICLWAVSLPLYTNWWCKVCYCIISEQNWSNCSELATPRHIEPKQMFSLWYGGIANMCITFVVSFVLSELFYLVLREVEISNKKHKMHLLQQKLKENVLEEARRVLQVKAMAFSDHESWRFEYEYEKEQIKQRCEANTDPRASPKVLLLLELDIRYCSTSLHRLGQAYAATKCEQFRLMHDTYRGHLTAVEVLCNDYLAMVRAFEAAQQEAFGNVFETDGSVIMPATTDATSRSADVNMVKDVTLCTTGDATEAAAESRELFTAHSARVQMEAELDAFEAFQQRQRFLSEDGTEDDSMWRDVCSDESEVDEDGIIDANDIEDVHAVAASQDAIKNIGFETGAIVAAGSSFGHEQKEDEVQNAEILPDTSITSELHNQLQQLHTDRHDQPSDVHGLRVGSTEEPSAVSNVAVAAACTTAGEVTADAAVLASVPDVTPAPVTEERVVTQADAAKAPAQAPAPPMLPVVEIAAIVAPAVGDANAAAPVVAFAPPLVDVPVPALPPPAPAAAALPVPVAAAAAAPIVPIAILQPRPLGLRIRVYPFHFLATVMYVFLFVFLLVVLNALLGRVLLTGSFYQQAPVDFWQQLASELLPSNFSEFFSGPLALPSVLDELLDAANAASGSLDLQYDVNDRDVLLQALYIKLKVWTEVATGNSVIFFIVVIVYFSLRIYNAEVFEQQQQPTTAAITTAAAAVDVNDATPVGIGRGAGVGTAGAAAATVNGGRWGGFEINTLLSTAKDTLFALLTAMNFACKLSLISFLNFGVVRISMALLISKSFVKCLSPDVLSLITDTYFGLKRAPMWIICYVVASMLAWHVSCILDETVLLLKPGVVSEVFLPLDLGNNNIVPVVGNNNNNNNNVPVDMAAVAAGLGAGARGGARLGVGGVGGGGGAGAAGVANAAGVVVGGGGNIAHQNRNPGISAFFSKVNKMSYSIILQRCLFRAALNYPAIVVMVSLPLRFGHLLIPFASPLVLRLKIVVVDIQVPIEMILSHVLLPIMIERIQYRHLVRMVLTAVLKATPLLSLEWMLNQESFPEIFDAPAPVVAPPAEPIVPAPAVEEEEQEPQLVVPQLQQRIEDDENEAVRFVVPQQSDTTAVIDGANEDVADGNAPDVPDINHAVLRVEEDAAAATAAAPIAGAVDVSTFARNRDFFLALLRELAGRLLPEPVRIGILVAAALVVTALMSSLLLHLPVLVGRYVLWVVGIPPNNDFFNIPIGFAVCWAVLYVLQYLIDDLTKNATVAAALTVARKWTLITVQAVSLTSFWLVVPPLMLGILLETTFVMPLRAPLKESPRMHFLQCWVMGLVVLKIWCRFVLHGMFGDPPIRSQFEMFIIRGFKRFDAHATLWHIIIPVTTTLMDWLLVPYFFARLGGVFVQSYQIRCLLIRFCVHIYATTRLLIAGSRDLYRYLRALHNEVRDSKYLVGTRLTNRE